MYTLRDHTDHLFQSTTPGTWGGHRQSRIYGRLDGVDRR